MAPPTGISAEDLLEFGTSLPETGLKEYAGSTAVTFRVRLDLVDADEMKEIVTDAWRHSAPQRLVAEIDGD